MHKNLKYHQAGPSVGVPMESGHDRGRSRSWSVTIVGGHDRGRARARAVCSWAVSFAGGLVVAGHDCGWS